MKEIEKFFKLQNLKEHSFDGTLYYDETNNFRKFYLRENGWNCESLNIFFVLGGVALEDGTSIDTAELRTLLQVQKNSKEIKFDHLTGKSNEWQYILRSNKIETFLDWMINNNLHIHYVALNYIYYALVDIVDAAMEQYKIYDLDLYAYLKNALYEIVKRNINDFVKILYKYDYPKITDTKGFMKEFMPFIEEYQNDELQLEEDFIVEFLRQIIKSASRQDNFDFFDDEEKHIIFKDLTSIYLTESIKFSNAKLVFDNEAQITTKVSFLNDVKFIDSKSEIFIQLSDVTVGLISRYFSFLEKTENVVKEIQQYDCKQIRVLRKLINLMTNSSKYNVLFDTYVGGNRAMYNHYCVCDYLDELSL